MPQADFAISMAVGVPVVTAPFEVNAGNASSLRVALLRSAAHHGKIVVLDMSGTELCDSAGLNVLVRCHRRAEAEGGDLRIVMPDSQVRRLLAVARLDRVLRHFASIEAALGASWASPAVAPSFVIDIASRLAAPAAPASRTA